MIHLCLSHLCIALALLTTIDSERRCATAQQPPIFINAGGPEFTDSALNVWSADVHYNTGKPYKKVVPISNTDDDTLYQTERWDPPTEPELIYDIPLLDGDYDVYLHFAENYWSAPGKRVFNVSIGESVVISKLDIYDEAGAGKTPLIKHVPATVTGGSLKIEFIHDVENPKVAGIHIQPSSSSKSDPASEEPSSQPSVNEEPSPPVATTTTEDESEEPSMVPSTEPSAEPTVDTSTKPSSTPTAAGESGTSPPTSTVVFDPILINAGGGEYIDSQNRVFQADRNFNIGKTWKPRTTVPITGTADVEMYQTERYDSSMEDPQLAYEFTDLPNGQYEVKLHFAELYGRVKVKGGRVFTVLMQGTPVFENVDIFEEAAVGGAGDTALVKSALVSVTSGVLSISFEHVQQNPKLNALEIHAVSLSSGEMSATSLSPSTSVPASEEPSSQPSVNEEPSPPVATTTTEDESEEPSMVPSTEPSAEPTVDTSTKPSSTPTAAGESGTSPPTSIVTFDPILINAGGGEYIDSQNRVFQADRNFNIGKTWKPRTTVPITGTADVEMYQTERYDSSMEDPQLAYEFTDLPNGQYEVKLHFAELYGRVKVKGGRVFTVLMQGTPVFENVDIFEEAAVGGAGDTALVKSALVSVSSGVLSISFEHVQQNPKLNALEIHAVSLSSGEMSATSLSPSTSDPASEEPSSQPSVNEEPSPPVATTTTDDESEEPSMVPSAEPSAEPTVDTSTKPSSTPMAAGESGTTPPTSIVTFDPILINVGGGEYIDSQNRVFQADRNFNIGSTWKPRTTVPITGTADVEMYQTERYDSSMENPQLAYEFKDLPNGQYEVKLHFAELYGRVKVKGGRVFTVLMQDIPVFENVDIFEEAAVGGAGDTALVKSALVSVTSGVLSISFEHVQQNPKLNALEIHAVSLSNEEIELLSEGTSAPSGSPEPSYEPSVAVSAPPSTSWAPSAEESFSVIRINAGGGDYTDVNGNNWTADHYYNTGSRTYQTSESIGLTEDDALYQTERWDPALVYDIPVPEGTFQVTLHFADIWHGTHEIGGRVFDVLIEGYGAWRDLDIFSEVGGYAALIKSTPTAVNDGSLTIEFIAVEDNPKISAIEVSAIGSVKAHQAHAVPSGPYFKTDGDADGIENVTVDGTYSHTHGIGANLISWKWFANDTEVGTGEIATLNLPVGFYNLTLEVTDSDNDVSRDYTTVTVRPFGYPDIVSLSTEVGDFAGGDTVYIYGSGFFVAAADVVVHFGLVPMSGEDITVVDDNTIIVHATPPRAPGTAHVTVETPLGVSTAISFTYINFSLPEVKWTDGTIIPNIYGPTTIAFGPDGRLYVGTQAGDIYRITLDDQYQAIHELTLISSVIGTSEASFRAIMGIAFDPMDTSPNPTVYVAHSNLFHGDIVNYNGKVTAVSGANLDSYEHVVTGLPVSDHDHGINGMEFGDRGELYIQVGGNTNAGIPGYLSQTELQEEGALSAATVVAYLSRPDYDGDVTYDENQDQISGFDVQVFASGQRNSYDIVLHSNGNLYATDNGPNTGFGKVSVDCEKEDNDPKQADKLNLIVEGGYYGHPCRKRAETDPRQCYWRSVEEPNDSDYTAPLTTLKSSANGIIEFQSDHFAGQLRGHLIVGRYKGALYDITLSEDGQSVLYNVEKLMDKGGLDLTQGPTGALFVAQHDKGQVIYYAPDEPVWTQLQVKSVFPRRGPEAGSSTLTLYGENLDVYGVPAVTVGGGNCPLVGSATFGKIVCTLPPGTGTVDIVVTAGAKTATFQRGYRYIPGYETSTMPSTSPMPSESAAPSSVPSSMPSDIPSSPPSESS